MGSSEGADGADHRELQRSRVLAISRYTELVVAYKELCAAGKSSEAALLVPDIDRVRDLVAECPRVKALLARSSGAQRLASASSL